MKPIITSFLDLDQYKISMAQCVLHRFSEAQVEFEFKNRTNTIDLFPYWNQIQEQINSLADLKFTEDELKYLSTIRYLKKDFIDFLRILRLNPKCVKIYNNNGEFGINITGSWLYTIWFETMILSIISEVYNQKNSSETNMQLGLGKLENNLCLINNAQIGNKDKLFRLIEFGTRRRFSKEYHKRVVELLIKKIPNNLFGTSNVKFAMDYGLKPIGTFAHEAVEAMQGMNCRLVDSQKMFLEAWAQEYRGDLGIALTDTIGIDSFLRDFDMYFAKLYDGTRQDSGNPVEFTKKVINHYISMGINPKEKVIVYSDSLDIPKAIKLWREFEGQVKTSYGIGTKLTADIPGITPVNIVIKMTKCNGKPVAKLSDSKGKTMCRDAEYLQYLKKVFNKE